MSALRRMLSALWAALWLRGRLLGVRLRRLFGGGPKAAAGPDFHLLGADVLTEEATHEPIELPVEMLARLEATRGELLRSAHAASASASRARPRSGRRWRTASIAVAAVLGIGAVGAGASALVTGSTGVPAVDRLLGIYEAGLDKPGASDRPGPSGSDLQPSPSKASEPIEVTLGDGSEIVTSFYVARDGKVCAATTAANDRNPGAPLACQPYNVIAARLSRHDGSLETLNALRSQVVIRGYVSDRVTSLTGRGPFGSLDVSLGEPWKPDLSDAEVLRPFVAVGDRVSGDMTDGSGVSPAFELQNYRFEAVTDDGLRIPIVLRL